MLDGPLPKPDELADDEDELTWDRSKHGLFAEQAEPDDTIETVVLWDASQSEK